MHISGEHQVKIRLPLSEAKEPPAVKRRAWNKSSTGTFRGDAALQLPWFQISSDVRLLGDNNLQLFKPLCDTLLWQP